MSPPARSTVMLTRRRFLTGLGTIGALSFALAACGGATTPTAAPSAAPSTAASSAPSSAPTTAAAAPSTAGSVAPTAVVTARAGATVATGATPSARASSTAGVAGTPGAQGLRLVPAKPADLGAPAVTAATKSTAAVPVPCEPAIAAYEPFGTDAAPGVFPRTIRHATGTTEIKTRPERVLPLDSGELDALVQLGLKPVGYLDYNAALMPAHLVTALQGVPTVGTLAEPKLEAIAAIRPELMLTTKVRHEKLADSLKAIAPTVFGISTGVVWKQNFALYARSLGREVEADVAVRGYEERVRKMNAALPAPCPAVSVIRVLNNNLRYYQRANYSGTILTDLGFQRHSSQNVDDLALLNQSLETLGASGDADHVVVCFTEGENGAYAKEFVASPLWQSFGAVKRGAVMFALDDVWMAGIGYRAADLILNDIAKYFKI